MSTNDERVSKGNKRYFTLNYDNLTEQSLKSMISGFKRSDLIVAEVIASNRARRVNGEPQKTAQFVFENGQSVTIAVGDQGDINQTKLNAKVIPVNNLSTISAYTKEVSQAVIANMPRYAKVLERKAKAAIKDVSNVKPASRTIKARIEEAKATLAAAQQNLSVATAEKAEVETQVNAAKTGADDYKKQIAALRTEESDLIKQIKALGGVI